MNKKIATLGLAAVLGLAGVASLPVIASSFGKTETLTGIDKTVDGKYDVVKTIVYNGKVAVDNTAIALQELVDYVKGTDGTEGTPNADLDTAKGAPTVKPTEAHSEVRLEGSLNHILKSIKALAAGITTDDHKNDLAGLKKIVIAPTDSDATLKLNQTDGVIKDIADFTKKLVNVKTIEFKLDPRVKILDLDALKHTEVRGLKGIVSFPTVEGVEKVDSANAMNIIEDLGVKFSAWGKDSKNNDLAPNAGKSNNQSQDNNQSQNQGNKTEDKAGDKNKKPEGGIKTPDTGIAE